MSAGDSTSEILRRLENIESRITSLDETDAFALRANRETYLEIISQIFGRSEVRAKAYLAADGTKTVQELADEIGVKRPNAGTELRLLAAEGLLEARQDGAQVFYGKKALDRTLSVSRFLRERFNL
ncbi:MAG: hypothetical protein AB7F65_06740 [Dehalococcoidia bacterium]